MILWKIFKTKIVLMKRHFFFLFNNKFIFATGKLYKFCRRDDDCEDINHSKCSENNECICRRNNVALNSSVCVPMMNGFCWKNEPCAADNSICIDNVCKCKPNFKYVADKICLKCKLNLL